MGNFLEKGFDIEGRIIGENQKTFIIAEVAQAHDGSLGLAHSFIDSAADCGADAIKFQTHIAEEESTLNEKFRINFSYKDKNRYEYWKRMEFQPNEWEGLYKHAQERGIVFLSSPFSKKAVKLLESLNIPAWKIGSGESFSGDLLDSLLLTSKPLLISTGMVSKNEINQIVKKVSFQKVPFALLQCTSKYPCPLEEVGLNLLKEFKEDYDCIVGLSDHSGTIYPSLAAIAQNCEILELHVTFDKNMFGPDSPSSVTFRELSQIIDFRNAFYKMKNNPIKKNLQAKKMKEMRSKFGKSLALKINLSANTIIKEEHLTLKKPGNGLQISDIKGIIGKRLVRDLPCNRLINYEDLA